MLLAILFSLALHALLLFMIKFAPASRQDASDSNASLHVLLEDMPAQTTQTAGIAQAMLTSKGAAQVGVQNSNRFRPQALTAAEAIPAAQTRTTIPETFIGKDIIAVNKPEPEKQLENSPELLMNHPPPQPEIAEDKSKPYAPAPSIENKVARTELPPATKLVSPQPVPGEKPEKIVYAEPAQEKSAVEKPGSVAESPRPARVEEPKPVKMEERPPVKIEEVKPVSPPIVPGKSAPIEPPPRIERAPAKPEEVKAPETVETHKAETASIKSTATAEPAPHPPQGVASSVFRNKQPGYDTPGPAGLNISAIRHVPVNNERKINFGDRKKVIGIREQDFRYAMYAESVHQKLERVGRYNYPAEAARKNLTGALAVLISIRADGSLEDFSIVQSSGYAVLDGGAEHIVRMSAPFSPLPDNIRQDTDILSIRINWSFSNAGQSLE
ncbi:MAG: TonB family protein [Nitrosomonadales bacterium]|nr:TonB family protein [Nitrosomonadales bacterium]